MSKGFLPFVSSESFLLSSLTLKSLIHFVFIFVYSATSILISVFYT